MTDQPTPGGRRKCDECGEELIAKCGEILVWHWSHPSDSICEQAGEASWHVAWKLWARAKGWQTEERIGSHRADIVAADGRIIELQSDYLDARVIREREDEYGARLSWVYRWDQARFDRLWNNGGGWWRWSSPARSMLAHVRPVLIHHRDRLYRIDAMRETGTDVEIRFTRGESDKLGPVLYGSQPAPFAVLDASQFIQGAMAARP